MQRVQVDEAPSKINKTAASACQQNESDHMQP